MTTKTLTKEAITPVVKNSELEYTPLLLDLTQEEDKKTFNQLIELNPTIHDTLQSQLIELYKCNNPKSTFEENEFSNYIAEISARCDLHTYGVWVYYSWNHTLIHLLPEKEFIQVRTNRNKFKITEEEQTVLQRKKVGVVGLSVGSAIAMTMAIERVFSEIKLADFDTIELSNLNRLNAPLSSLGVSKALLCARRISEIDPFLKVSCYFDGLTEENIEDFFQGGGPLDVCIEECDGLHMKVLVRKFAKQYKIPVVMETNEKGMLDIERFDLEEDYPIFHGLISDIESWDLDYVKNLSDEDKVPYVLKIIGEDTLSERFVATLIEITHTLRSWPQLASGVMLGGGTTCDVVRRMFLNQLSISGRFFVDVIGTINNDTPSSITSQQQTQAIKGDTKKSISLPDTLSFTTTTIDSTVLSQLLEDAITAPSGRNGQPWEWIITKEGLDLRCNQEETLTDFEDCGGYVAIGAAYENFMISANTKGYQTEIQLFPDKTDKTLVGKISLHKQTKTPTPYTHLYPYLNERSTNRKLGNSHPIDSTILKTIEASVDSIPGASLEILSSKKELIEIADIIGESDKLRFLIKDYHQELISEIRWSEEETQKTRDGIDIDTLDLSPTDKAGLILCKNWEAMTIVKNHGLGNALKKMSRKQILSSSNLCLIKIEKSSPTDYFQGGRAMQRAWLTSSKHQLGFHPMAVLNYYFARLIRGNGKGMPDDMKKTLWALRNRYQELFSINDNNAEIMMFRLFQTDSPPSKKSLRKPLSDVVRIDNV
ncbi:hypothetical protein DID77_04275 [Candidatus Marinamargulisbacteria bacterium SCGC AG-439-L15]|nr:hypothetical protein DID77_04275 [Candidatus Marinamargulisbacteria bacterium SCGC AG-439-L15]